MGSDERCSSQLSSWYTFYLLKLEQIMKWGISTTVKQYEVMKFKGRPKEVADRVYPENIGRRIF